MKDMNSMESKSKSLSIQLADIRKVFSRGTVDEVRALNGIDLDIYKGDFITVIGSNGAGKSTLLNVIAGVFPPERGGRIIINGKDVTDLPEYKKAAHVGRVWQQPEVGTARNLSIEENLSMAMLRGKKRTLRKAVNRTRRETFGESLTPLGLGLEKRLTALVGTLSGGQRQALSLVMATLSRPTILLLDEHIATLDPRTAEKVLQLTDMVIQKDRMTSMMVTHNMEVALKYGNRLIMMHKGKKVVYIGRKEKKTLGIDDLVRAFERAAGEQFKDDSILLSDREC